jgi:FixJ family two-component response regulator
MYDGPTVFVVDDDLEVGQSLSWLLTEAGLSVQLFTSGRDFLDTYQPHHEEACLLLDVRMPGMSGLEVQRELASRGADVPVIFLTVYSDVTTRGRALRAGALDVLEKPVNDVRLMERINEAMARCRRAVD